MASKEEIRRVSIYINGTEAELTLKEIEKGAAKLRAELGRLVPGTEEFRKKMQELRDTREVLQDVNDDIKGIGGAFGWLKTEIGKLGILATGYLGFEFITEQFKNIISQNAKLADSIADIQKTTGMSEAAVRRLQQSFKSIDTRTSRAELSGLAEVAGKLGISGEEDVLGFVRAADQINVALGKDLGDAESAINDLGKLTEIFKIKDAYGLEQALIKTGSAINDLGAIGTANEGYIVEFTKRLGGVAPAANISIQNIMGLGASMDELGQPVEAAATAIGQFIVGLGSDIPRFAKIAGMSIQEFSQLLQTDGNAALIAVIKNLNSTGQGVQGLATSMGMIGEDGARATAALGLLANNIDLVEKRQQQANDSFAEGTSLTNEYNTKNSNFAASLDRLKKKFGELVSNHTVTDFLVSATEATETFMSVLNASMATIGDFIKLMIAGAVGFVTYRTVVALAAAAQKDWIATLVATDAYQKLVIASETAWAVLKLVLTGRIREARAAMVGFNAVMEANPLGLVLASVTAVVTALILFKDTMTDAERAQETLNKVKQQGIEKVSDETEKIKLLNGIMTDHNKKQADRIAAMTKLRDIIPGHLKGYTDEQLLASKATDAINQYILSLEKRAAAEAAFEELKRLKIEERQIKSQETSVNWAQGVGVVLTDMFAGSDAGDSVYKNSAEANKHRALAANKARQDALMENYKSEIQSQALTPPGTGNNSPIKITDMTRDQLRIHIQKLNQELDQTAQGTKEYIRIANELKAANAQMKAINKDTGTGGQGSNPENKIKSFLKQSAELSTVVKNFNADQLIDLQTKNEKEIQANEQKYNELIEKAKNFQKEIAGNKELDPKQKATETAKHQAEIDQLTIDRDKTTKAIIVRQEDEMVGKIRDLREQLGEVYESERQKEITRINSFYDQLLDDAADNYEEWELIEFNRAKDLTDAKIREEKRFKLEVEQLEMEGNLTDADRERIRIARINKHYDDQVAALKKKYSKELQATKEFKKALEIIEKNRKDAIDSEDEANKKQMREALIQGAIDTARTVADAVFDIQKSNRDAEMASELDNIEKQREKELSNKNLTEAGKKAINDKYDKQAAEVKRKNWEEEKEASIQKAIINGALAVGMAFATTPWPLSIIQAGVAAAATAAQVLVIQNTKPPKFEDGGYSAVDYNKPQGWVRSPTLFPNSASGRTFSAGENYKTEYIISSEQLKDPVIADFVGAMESNRMVRRFEAGGYSNATVKVKSPKTVSNSTTPKSNDSARLDAMERMLIKQAEINAAQAKINERSVVINTTTWDEQEKRNAQIRTEAGA